MDKLSAAAKHQLDAMAVTKAAVEFIRGSERPFFILIHYHDTHWPYRAAREHLDSILKPGDPDIFAGRAAEPSGKGGPPPEDVVQKKKK